MASRLLSNDMTFRDQVISRIRSVMEEMDMAIYGRNSGISFVYGNLGDLLKKVQSVGATSRPNLFQRAIEKKDKVIRQDSIRQLKENVSRLQEMQNRLNFMLTELEVLVKKG